MYPSVNNENMKIAATEIKDRVVDNSDESFLAGMAVLLAVIS